MKRIVITFAIALICGKEAIAQNNLSKLSIGLTTSIEENLSGERINFDQHSGYAAQYDKTNYRIGVNLAYALKENLSVVTAVEYSNKDFKGRFFCETCNTLFPSEFMNIDYRFIEIPITLRYYMLPGKIRLFIEGGMNNLFALNNDTVENTYALGIKLGSGIAYNINEKIAIQLGVNYYNGITNFYKESDFKIKTITFGLGVIKKL